MTGTTTLFNDDLAERELGRSALRVSDLLAWIGEIKGCLPATSPNVLKFESVQIEALLTAMSNAVHEMPADMAIRISAEFECDPATRALIEGGNETIARWLVGGIGGRWRKRIGAALSAGDLHAFDAVTGEPIATAHWSGAPATGLRGEVATEGLWLTSGQIAHLFDGVHFTHEKWLATFNKKVPRWLSVHKKVPGKPGNSSQPARWNPLGIAKALAAMKNNERRKPLSDHESKRRYDTLNVRFKLKAELAPWRDEWAAFYSLMQDD